MKVEKNPNFRRWFGDSKVVDENGKPLLVFHGTAEQFSVFKQGRGGFYFTSDRKAADEYARHAEGEAGPRVVEAYLSINNPMVLDRAWYDENVIFDGEPDWGIVDNTIFEAEQHGHDGLILRGFPDFDGIVFDHPGQVFGRRVEREYDQYVVFRPEQIKSAIGNSGAFDPHNPDICDAPRSSSPSPNSQRRLLESDGPAP